MLFWYVWEQVIEFNIIPIYTDALFVEFSYQQTA
jgi:hypothetical protein